MFTSAIPNIDQKLADRAVRSGAIVQDADLLVARIVATGRRHATRVENIDICDSVLELFVEKVLAENVSVGEGVVVLVDLLQCGGGC